MEWGEKMETRERFHSLCVELMSIIYNIQQIQYSFGLQLDVATVFSTHFVFPKKSEIMFICKHSTTSYVYMNKHITQPCVSYLNNLCKEEV